MAGSHICQLYKYQVLARYWNISTEGKHFFTLLLFSIKLHDQSTWFIQEQCACQVIVAAGGVNQILRTSIRCWIEDVTAINEYDRQEKIWTEWETAEQKEVPVVTRRRGPQKAV